MLMTRYSLLNPVAVTLFFVLLVAAGMLAFTRMGRSVLPDVAVPVVSISAPYPGAAPAEIEQLVIEPIEDRLQALPALDRVSSFAQDGSAFIVARFAFGTNIDADRANVQQAVDAADPNMPADLLPPAVENADPSQSPVFDEAISSVLLSPGSLSALLDRQIMPALRAAGAIGSIRSSGEAARALIVSPRSVAMSALAVTPLDVFRSVAAGNDTLPGGRLRSAYREIALGIDASARSADSIGALPLIAPGRSGLRVRDVADVFDGYADQRILTRVDDEPAVVLSLAPAHGSSASGAIASARRIFADLSRRFPAVRFQNIRADDSATSAAVGGVLQTLGEGIVLTVLVMLLFLHAWRAALVAAVAIPTSLCAAFLAMWVAGFTVNVLSLMGLSLTIGILVDDAIVIIEAIRRAFERGEPANEAALAGRSELGAAAFAITAVDVAVFAPVAMMNGIVGEFMREFGLVVVFATAFSLLVSFTLTPLLMARWSAERNTAHLRILPWTLRTRAATAAAVLWRAFQYRFESAYEYVAVLYAKRLLPAAFRRRKLVLTVASACCALSFAPLLAGAIPTEFSPPINNGLARITIQFPAGAPLARTDARARLLVQRLLEDDSISTWSQAAGAGSTVLPT